MNIIFHYRWVILGLVVYCQLAQAITYQGIPPILGILVASLGISYAQAGGLMSLYSLPRIFLALPGGFLVDRYGTRKVGGISLLTLSLGMAIFAAGNSYLVLG
ncbi:MFS transporter, partial [Thermodesulfobacteriota bacterium]